MNYTPVLNAKLCSLSSDYVNSLMYGTCTVDLKEIKKIVMLKFLVESQCKSYNVRCLLEKY